MPSYRPPVSRTEFHRLEAYQFKLIMFLNHVDHTTLTTEKQIKIQEEIEYMNITLSILRTLIPQAKNEIPVFAWPVDPEEYGYDCLFQFSCGKVASMALSVNPSKVAQVCKNKDRNSTGGWFFCYASDYPTCVTARHLETPNIY